MVPDASIAFAALTLIAFNAGGRPPTRPRARLAVNAVRVRSHTSSISPPLSGASVLPASIAVETTVESWFCATATETDFRTTACRDRPGAPVLSNSIGNFLVNGRWPIGQPDDADAAARIGL
jgi:hypothetical protein